MIRVAVDAMGGDYAPVEMVKGAVDAVAKTDQIEIALVGKEDVVRRELEIFLPQRPDRGGSCIRGH